MRALIRKYRPIMAFIAFVMMAMQLLIGWIFIRFVHYRSQIATLPVESYQVELITAEDYAKLQDRSLDVVELSNGTRIADRQPIWYERVLPNYKKVDGFYVHVTTLGTAHYYKRWMGDILPLVILTLCGLVVTWYDLRHGKDAGAGASITSRKAGGMLRHSNDASSNY
jgi:hypothetical protein